MLDKAAAQTLAQELDLDGIPACPLCLFELAWELHENRRPHTSLVARTADWTWPELEDGVRAAVVRARMREVPHAEDALRELEEEGFRGRLARVVVRRLARELADELSS